VVSGGTRGRERCFTFFTAAAYAGSSNLKCGSPPSSEANCKSSEWATLTQSKVATNQRDGANLNDGE
jgi:hypothetical protein